MNIIRGIQKRAIRLCLYGTEGIGKSTFAAQFPKPIFLDTEDGSNELNVDRVMCNDFRAIEGSIKELQRMPMGYKTCVIDTADWMEKAIIEHMLRLSSGKKSIEDFGFGKGYTMLAERLGQILLELDKLIEAGMHVVMTAHAKVQKVSPPDMTDGFDRYELKMTKHCAPLIKEWADMLLFANYRVHVVDGTDGRTKAHMGSNERILFTSRTAAYDAKNRYGLEPELEFDYAKIAHLFEGTAPVRQKAPAPTPDPRQDTKAPEARKEEKAPETRKEEQQDTKAPETPAMATAEQQTIIEAYVESTMGGALIERALANANAVGIDELTAEDAEKLIIELKEFEANQQAKANNTIHFPSHVSSWLQENAKLVNSYLVKLEWITPKQTWEDISQQQADDIAESFPRFQAGVKRGATK